MALLLALARNVPQAHASLTGGKWERSKFSGVELYEKTLGILGFGRIGQLVAQRARGFGMRVIAFDPYVAPSATASSGSRRPTRSDDVYAAADFLTLHLPKTPDTEGWLDAEALAKCKDGVRILNVARGPLVVDEDLKAALDSGKVAGAALDVFRSEPVTEHPLFGYPNVIVTPHLGASTAEATDRAGYQAAEQVVAALTGGVVTSAVNVPAIPAEDMEVLGPFVPLCRSLGRIAIALARRAPRSTASRPSSSAGSPSATRGCCRSRCCSACCAATPRRTSTRSTRRRSPTSAGSRSAETKHTQRPRLHRPDPGHGDAAATTSVRVAGTLIGRRNRAAPARGVGPAVRRPARGPHHAVPLPRPARDDRPGRARSSAPTGSTSSPRRSGASPTTSRRGDGRLAAMAITTDSPVPHEVVDEIVASDGFVAGRTVTL